MHSRMWFSGLRVVVPQAWLAATSGSWNFALAAGVCLGDNGLVCHIHDLTVRGLPVVFATDCGAEI